MERKYIQSQHEKNSNEEKRALGELVGKFKLEYDVAVVQNSEKTKYDKWRRTHVLDLPKKDYVSQAVHAFYVDLKDCKFDDTNFKLVCKVAARAFESLSALSESSSREDNENLQPQKSGQPFCRCSDKSEGLFPETSAPNKSKRTLLWLVMREPAFRKRKTIEIWRPLVKIGNSNLRKPNKCCSISQEDRIICLQDYLQNVWSVLHYFINKDGMDPPVINGDQMPLHRNESIKQKTLTFKNQNTFVKEIHMLSCERKPVLWPYHHVKT